jgi:hypothetical protein
MSNRSVINVIGGNERMATRVQINENDQKTIANTMDEYKVKDLNIDRLKLICAAYKS